MWRAGVRQEWLRGLDSNQDNQLQRLACYQLHYPGLAQESLAEIDGIVVERTWFSVNGFAAVRLIC
jgi:hypothetical protein